MKQRKENNQIVTFPTIREKATSHKLKYDQDFGYALYTHPGRRQEKLVNVNARAWCS